jgi:hypothetical protein
VHEFARMSLDVMGQALDLPPGARPSELEVRMHVLQAPAGHVAFIAAHGSSKYSQRTHVYGNCCAKHYALYKDTTSLTELGYIDSSIYGPHRDCSWCSMPLAGHLA